MHKEKARKSDALPEKSGENQTAHELTAAKRENTTLRKLVAGMTVGAYGGFGPEGQRSRLATEIANDCDEAGVPLDRDTVLKHLRLAKEILPHDA